MSIQRLLCRILCALIIVSLQPARLTHGDAMAGEPASGADEDCVVDRSGEAERAAFRILARTGPLTTVEACGEMVEAALVCERADAAQALAGLDRVIGSDRSGVWIPSALYHKARICQGVGCDAEARGAINQLRAAYPESSFTVQVGIIDAQMTGGDRHSAERIWSEEQIASPLFDTAMKALRDRDRAVATNILQGITDAYPQTAAALRARHRLGYLLADQGRRLESVTVRLNAIERAGPVATRSAFVEANKIRAAATLYGLNRRSEAMSLCRELEHSSRPDIAAEARIELAGNGFERLQLKRASTEAVSAGEWDQVRSYCRAVWDAQGVSSKWKCRAGLMYVETLAWEKRHEDAIRAADQFLAEFAAEPGLKRDIATVRVCLGNELYATRQYERALAEFRKVVRAYAGERRIWRGMDHLPYSYYMVWRLLERLHAPPAEVEAAAGQILQTFPDSNYARALEAFRSHGVKGTAE